MIEHKTHQVKAYRVMNDWLNKTLLETNDFSEACEEKAKQEALNQHDEIILVAVIEVANGVQKSLDALSQISHAEAKGD